MQLSQIIKRVITEGLTLGTKMSNMHYIEQECRHTTFSGGFWMNERWNEWMVMWMYQCSSYYVWHEHVFEDIHIVRGHLKLLFFSVIQSRVMMSYPMTRARCPCLASAREHTHTQRHTHTHTHTHEDTHTHTNTHIAAIHTTFKLLPWQPVSIPPGIFYRTANINTNTRQTHTHTHTNTHSETHIRDPVV